MQKILVIFFLVFRLSPSHCVAEQSPEQCGGSHFKLSLFGGKTEDTKWSTSYHLDSSSCNATDNWKLIVQQNVTESGGMRHIQLRGFFTENWNTMGGKFLPQSLTDDNLKGKCKGEDTTEELELKIVSRREWNAREPVKVIEAWSKPVVRVYAHYSDSPCFNVRTCKLAMMNVQMNEIGSYGDIGYNFYSDENGIIYEGLGWDRRKDADCNLKYFLDQEKPPSRQQLQSFGLLVAKGIKLGKISPNFKVDGNARVSEISNRWFNMMKYA